MCSRHIQGEHYREAGDAHSESTEWGRVTYPWQERKDTDKEGDV
jgi:hypothetical protein